MIGEGMRVVESEADEEHGETPPDRGEHSLSSILISILFAEQVENGGIGEGHARTAKELADDDE